MIGLDRGDGDDHVEDLLQCEVGPDRVIGLCGDQQRAAHLEDPGPVLAEDGIVVRGVFQDRGGDVPLAGRVRENRRS